MSQFRRIPIAVVGVLAAITIGFLFRHKGAIGRSNGILLVSYDAGVADHFGAYGYRRNTTPVTDRLGQEGMVFRNVFAVAPYTLSSFASMFTSKYPVFTNVIREGDVIDPKDVTLAQTLREAGFSTAAFVTSGFLDKSHGYAKGFDTFVNYEEMTISPEAGYAMLLRDLDRFLGSFRGRRFFILVHVLLPHNPYAPPEAYRTKFVHPGPDGGFHGTTEELVALDGGKLQLGPDGRQRVIDLYDANLNYGDDFLGRVLDRFRRAGKLESTDVVVTSDHGEAFGQHGRYLHNSTSYDEMIHIPLVIRPANHRQFDTDIAWLADNVDLFPTILDLADVPTPHGLQGWSLLRRAHATRKPYILSYVAALESVGLRSLDFKFIRHQIGGSEYYALADDPAESRNLMTVDAAKYSRDSVLAEYQAALASLTSVSKAENRPVSAEAAARIWALGYVSPVSATSDTPLSPDGFRVRYGKVVSPDGVSAGETFHGTIELKNLGRARWSSFGRFPVRLGIRWYQPSGAIVRESRAALPGSVGPGESREVGFELEAPDKPGPYRVAVELIQEFVDWFSAKGQTPAETNVVVR